jgi:hypothetical protein
MIMMKTQFSGKKILASIAIILLCGASISAQNGKSELVYKDGSPYSGTAFLKFAVIADQSTLWSNDGSSTHGAEPIESLMVAVDSGHYTIELGRYPMKPIFTELISLYPQAFLRTWINTGAGFSHFRDRKLKHDANHEPNWASSTVLINNITQNADYNEKKKDHKSAFNADGLMKERWMKRADENGNIPFDALINAKHHLEAMPKVATDDAGLWVWEWLGPGNIGGRIRAINIHPTSTNTIFIGSVSGGIWRSTNGGTSWTPINDFMANLNVTSIVRDPTNANIMYASTGEGVNCWDCLPGAGIFKSTNGGSNWSQLASTNTSDFKWVNRLAHHPDSASVLYAVTSYPNRIYKTVNGGTSWTQLYVTASPCLDIRICEASVSRLIAGCANDVYISSNWGKTWTDVSTGLASKLPDNPGRCEVSFAPSLSYRVYASINTNGGEIWRSDNFGSTWTQRYTGSDYLGTQGWYNNCIWIDPTNSSLLVVGGIDNWRSTDGGATITKISDWTKYHNGGSANSAHADNHIIINHPGYDGSTNKTVFFGNDGGIQKATDITTVSNTSGWTNLCSTTLGISQFYGGACFSDGSVMIGGTQDNDNLRYRSSGSWSGPDGWFQDHTGDGTYCAIDQTNKNIFFTAYTNLWIDKSTDGGDNYSGAATGITDAGDGNRSLFVSPFSMDPNTSTRLIAGGADIWRTTNGGTSWSSIKPDIGGRWIGADYVYYRCTAIDIATGNSNIIWVGHEDGYLYKTTNGTNASPTWTRVDENPTALPNRWVSDIAINPNNHNEVWVVFSGYVNNNVWFTSDGGSNWSNRTGTAPNDVPALTINTVRVHPSNSNWIYIGTDLGVLSSMDKGLNWSVMTQYADNEGPANVEVSELVWQGTYLVAFTHGRGAYRAHPLEFIYVDKNWPAGGNGTLANPYNNVTDAVNNAGHGATIIIRTNTYDEPNPLLFNKKGMIMTSEGATIIK